MDNNNTSKSTSANAASTQHQHQHQQQKQQQQQQQQQQQLSTPSTNSASTNPIEGTQDLTVKTRRLQLEIEEKDDIINILKEELETLREQSDKFQRENLELVKDAKRVKFLQDENDFLQDQMSSVERYELEIKRLKEKLNELDFLKLRVAELEDDRNKAQEEAQEAEKLKADAESKLGRLAELESEVNKWKTFSHELEQTRDSMQTKLLESIEHESKLVADNKKIEDEIRRLRDLVKSYEEHRDEEQASASLKSVGNEVMFAVNQELVSENDNLKSELKRKESDTKEIRDELESNRKLISNLRQDLACEKSIAQKLTNQLARFKKEIKVIDKQYFPMHDTNSDKTTPMKTSNEKTKVQTTSSSSNRCGSSPIAAEKVVTPPPIQRKQNDKAMAAAVATATTANAEQKPTEADRLDANGIERKSLKSAKKAPDSVNPKQISGSNFVRNSLSSRSVNFGHSRSPVAYLDRIRASVSATTNTSTMTSHSEQSSSCNLISVDSSSSHGDNTSVGQQQTASKQQQVRHGAKDTPFVLNCMLDHDHTERCFIAANSVAPAQVQVYGAGQQISLAHSMCHSPFVTAAQHHHGAETVHHQLMAESAASGFLHPHNSMAPGKVSTSRQLNALIDPVAHDQLLSNMIQQQVGQQTKCLTQHQQYQQQQQQLTEQQVAHLNNLHRQHYYHHLHELYQMHHQHHLHLHHLHQHKCSKQQHQGSSNHHQNSNDNNSSLMQSKMPKTVGSQFQAPILNDNHHHHQMTDRMQQQQVYANLDSASTVHSSRISGHQEQNLIATAVPPLVITGDTALEGGRAHQQQFRKSPQRSTTISGINGNLPQIDESNGLPLCAMESENVLRHLNLPKTPINRSGGSNSRILSNTAPIQAPLITKGQQRQIATDGSPMVSSASSSSPTSSSRASSNSSPSSTSSIDSLAASNRLNRSLPARHSTTDVNRRQFSVEQELVGQTPMTAKLSRVGSCRGFSQPASHMLSSRQVVSLAPVAVNGLPSPQPNGASGVGQQLLLRNPAKTQLPSMKTSKILNISNGQQQQQQLASAHGQTKTISVGQLKQQQQQQQQQQSSLTAAPSPDTSSPSRYKQLNQLAENLADIKLNDGLAFSSLRAPKKSSSGSNLLLNKSLDSQRNLVSATKVYGSNGMPMVDKHQARPLSTNSHRNKMNDGNNNGNDSGGTNFSRNKSPPSDGQAAKSSSVWFEYGCV